MRTVDRVVRFWIPLIAAGCGHGSGSTTAEPDAGTTPRRTIMATAVERHYTALGETTNVIGSAVVSVSTRDATGGFHPGGFLLTGNVFTITVDDGLVYLELRGEFQAQREFIVDPADQVEAGSLIVGDFIAGPGAPLTYGGDGLLPWRGDDSLVAVCPNAAATRFPGAGSPLVQLNATTFGPSVVNDLPRLISAARGDVLWILQQRRDSVDGVSYRHYERTLEKPSIEQTPGSTVDVQGSFIAPAADQLDLDVRLSQFAAVAGVAPDKLKASLNVVYQPFGMPRTFGTVGDSRDLVELDLSQLSQDKVISLPFGNPFPSGFALYVELQVNTTTKDYALPGTRPLVLGGGLYLEAPLGEAEAAPLVPLIGPVSGLFVDGAPAGQAAHVSQTPTLAWQAPAPGKASGFVVDVFRLSVPQGSSFTNLEDTARFFTTQTSLQIPPGVLQTGQTYFFEVTALSGGIDVRSAPHHVTGAYSASRTLSDRFTL
jgi:hypothetical protein